MIQRYFMSGDGGCSMLDAGYWMLDNGWWILYAGYLILALIFARYLKLCHLQPSTHNLQPTTFNPQPSTHNLQSSTLNPQPLNF